MRAETDLEISGAWLNAGLQRQKRLPKLDTLLKSKPAEEKRISPEQRAAAWESLRTLG